MTAYSEPDLRISVVVCTRNSMDRICETLISLSYQSMSPNAYEVIVVDNASDDGTCAFLQHQCARLGFRYVSEPRLGLSNARNRGIGESHGRLVYFTDDDAVVPAHVLDVLWQAHEAHDADVVGGPVHGLWNETPPDWFLSSQWRRVSLLSYGSEPRLLAYPDILIGCNMAFRRSVFDRFGMFDPSFGRKGASLVGNEERILEWKIMTSGGRVFYEPSAYVFHKVASERMSMDYLRRRTLAGAKSNLLMNEITGADDQMLNRFVRLLSRRQRLHRLAVATDRLLDGLRFRRSILRRAVRLFKSYYRFEVMLQTTSRQARIEHITEHSLDETCNGSSHQRAKGHE